MDGWSSDGMETSVNSDEMCICWDAEKKVVKKGVDA